VRTRVVLAGVAALSALAVTSTATVVVEAPAAATGPVAADPAAGAVEAVEAAGAEGTAPLRWRRCRHRDLRETPVRCAFLRVPLDYARPQGPQIRIALSRLRHRSPAADYQGVVLVNPGGPGGPGRVYARIGDFMPRGSGRDYDWIGFDPRGVGASRPALSCIPSYFRGPRPPYRPTTGAILGRWLTRTRSYADACQTAAPRLLAHMRTTDVARDVDRIRRALGAGRINFYGYSYGTYLGQVYATLFPARVRRMVFDSNVDPRFFGYRGNLQQNVGFERVMQRWFAWIADHRVRYRLGRTGAVVERRFYRQQRMLRARPVGGVVGPSEWHDLFLVPGYAQFVWPRYARLFSDWVHERSGLLRFYRGQDFTGNERLFAVYNAVQCTDSRWPQRWRTWARDNRRVHRRAPFATWANAWFNAPCRVWPAPSQPRVRVDGHRARALLIGETLDGATPFSGSLEVRARFPGSRLVAIAGGTTHAGSPFVSPPCANRRLAAFLETGRLPARRPGRRADVRCRALPEPLSRQARRPVATLRPTPPTGLTLPTLRPLG
jgi:pimeloyl-ACP methyl ester carboxylesterase